MSRFNNTNVLSLTGICFDDNDFPLVVMPYMKNGSLLHFIKNHSNTMDRKMILKFAIEVAQGNYIML